MFRNSFATLVNAFANYIPTYRDYVMTRDMHEDYRYYRLQLQAILAQRPGQPLVLKDPCHTWHLDALLAVFPDARIIHLHRELHSVVGSFASLCQALQEGSSEVRSNHEIGAYASEMLLGGMDAMLRARKAHPDARFIDVGYHELVYDPMGTVAALHDTLELPYDDEAQAATQAWLDASSALVGRHGYSLETYGIGDETMHGFAPYADRFAAFLPVTTEA